MALSTTILCFHNALEVLTSTRSFFRLRNIRTKMSEEALETRILDPMISDFSASGLIVFDRLLSGLDLNQCEINKASMGHSGNRIEEPQLFHAEEVPRTSGMVINHFHGTHKCHRDTSTVR